MAVSRTNRTAIREYAKTFVTSPIRAPAILGAHDVDAVVYFTDGDGPFAPEPPPVPTLWVLTKPRAFACPCGQRARLRPAR